ARTQPPVLVMYALRPAISHRAAPYDVRRHPRDPGRDRPRHGARPQRQSLLGRRHDCVRTWRALSRSTEGMMRIAMVMAAATAAVAAGVAARTAAPDPTRQVRVDTGVLSGTATSDAGVRLVR